MHWDRIRQQIAHWKYSDLSRHGTRSNQFEIEQYRYRELVSHLEHGMRYSHEEAERVAHLVARQVRPEL